MIRLGIFARNSYQAASVVLEKFLLLDDGDAALVVALDGEGDDM